MNQLANRGQSRHRRIYKPLNYEDVYPCPVCRHGQLSSLMLMDALACNFCRHIFTVDLAQQSIRLEDSPHHLQWRWRGWTWKPLRQSDTDLDFGVWLIGVLLSTLPATLVWLSYWTFPTLPDSAWSRFPLIWTGLTFVSHLAIALWLVVEHYQFSTYVALKVRLQRLRGQL